MISETQVDGDEDDIKENSEQTCDEIALINEIECHYESTQHSRVDKSGDNCYLHDAFKTIPYPCQLPNFTDVDEENYYHEIFSNY